jgi:hypothetical protein
MRTALAWISVCVMILAGLPPCRCTKSKLPSWLGPNTLLGGTLPSSRFGHGFASCDDGRIYLFGGWLRTTKAGDMMRTDGNRSAATANSLWWQHVMRMIR